MTYNVTLDCEEAVKLITCIIREDIKNLSEGENRNLFSVDPQENREEVISLIEALRYVHDNWYSSNKKYDDIEVTSSDDLVDLPVD
jgi:hypothetical protein